MNDALSSVSDDINNVQHVLDNIIASIKAHAEYYKHHRHHRRHHHYGMLYCY